MSKRLASFIVLAVLGFPTTAQACKPSLQPDVHVTVAKRAGGPRCRPRFVTVRIVVQAEGRTITVVVRVPPRQHHPPTVIWTSH